MKNDPRHRDLFTFLAVNSGPEWMDFLITDVIAGIGAVLVAHPDEADMATLKAHLFTHMTAK